ncbi:acyl carrier protein [Kibdelosporangium persicum]|uniref:Actinorhodin polyketide synthase n=1 Tax=Kibdelosporangium persicum TaxID=2698649 RepID=A0ABX2FJF0_9PSEU|nr:phosphopantetheine-binding protein [Kibdelosporangium persicum]NRN71012.1 Actinorhodin polyketide synthase [Kibdelosporangium persicum]
MSEFTLDDLREIMRASTGVDEGVDLDGDIADVEFDDLGYDSLAVLELCGQVGRRYGVQISDDAASEMPTPARAVEFINTMVAKARV